jgi:hypothetical protein
MGDFIDAIGRNVGGLIGGSINALVVAWNTIISSLQQLLPGPLFYIVVGGVALLVAWWFFKR